LRRFLSLAAIEVFVWLILLVCTFLISKVVFAISLGVETVVQRISTAVIRILMAGVIAVFWLVLWKKLTDFYFWRRVTRK